MKLKELYSIIDKQKKEMPKNSYTAKLLSSGKDRVIQKVGEESIEVVIAAKNTNKQEVISEISDLLFHLFVLMSLSDITLGDIEKELETRKKILDRE